MIYALKKIIKFLIITITILLLVHWGIIYLIVRSRDAYVLSRIDSMVEELLEMPYRDIRPYDVGMNYGDLEDITYEEWMSMECQYTDTTGKMYYSSSSSSLNTKIKALGEKSQKHLDCIRPKFMTGKNIANIEVKKIDSPALVVVMNQYILKYPKVLNNLIKIAEKPCRYLQDLPSREEAEKLPDREHELIIKEKIHFKNQVRDELFCDTRTKRFTIIRIVDSNNETKYDIVVPRIDLPEKDPSWWKKYFG